MLELIKLRAQLLSNSLPVDEMKDIKLKATSEIDTGNKLLGKAVTVFLIFFFSIAIGGNVGWRELCYCSIEVIQW
jgi:DOCK N-terminus